LHRQHAEEVRGALRSVMTARVDELLARAYPPNSLLGVVVGRTGGSGSGCPTITAGVERGLVIDRGRFELRLDGVPLFLGNSNEFRVVERLARLPLEFVSLGSLIEAVWGGKEPSRNTLQQVMSNLRRAFRDRGFKRLTIDGKQNGYYRLVLAD